MWMSSFLCFCFYENLQELNGVRMRMDGEKDEFLFFESWKKMSLFLSFSKGWLVGDLGWLVNSKQIIEVDWTDGSSMAW